MANSGPRALADVWQDSERHPEGDVLYHTLQVFELACDAVAYDEEFLTAALLHDVGKAIDRRDHVTAGLAALEGLITLRTAWFIENLSSAQDLVLGALGARARRRLEASPDYDELTVLAECDRKGRVRICPSRSSGDQDVTVSKNLSVFLGKCFRSVF